MKTLKGWRGDLGAYLKVGDEVDEGIVNHFIETLPPRVYTSKLVQMGEPYSHVAGRPTWPTIEQVDGHWYYRGNCFAGEVKDRDPK